jgi:hypothetical protein
VDRRQAAQIIYGSIGGLADWSAKIKGRIASVEPDTLAERDEELSGSILFPSAIVTGLLVAAADQIGGWAKMAGSDSEPKATIADYSLFRPTIEALAEVIWILDGDNSKERVERSIELARIELKHGRLLAKSLRKAGTPDERVERSMAALESHVQLTLRRLGWDPAAIVQKLDPKSSTLDPSSITRKIGRAFKGPSLELNRYWGIASAHAHSQLITTLTFSVRDSPSTAGGEYLHDPDEILIAEMLLIIQRLIETATDLLNRRGYSLQPASLLE